MTRRSFLEKNRSTVKAYLRGLAESVRALMADKEGTIAVMSRVLRIDDLQSLDDSYRAMRSEAR